jgi:predicted nucleic acid-binding Zn ribbon protein
MVDPRILFLMVALILVGVVLLLFGVDFSAD